MFKIRANGSIRINLERKIYDKVRTADVWYNAKGFSPPMIVLMGAIDLFGFRQIANATIMDDSISRWIIVFGFLVGFEISPLYIGYCFCLRSYNLGKKIHKIVLRLAVVAFFLGIVTNIVYRWSTMGFVYSDTPEIQEALTFTFTTIPIITSLTNIILGCLSIDPLLVELNKYAKKLRLLGVKKRQLVALIAEYSDDSEKKKQLIESEADRFERTRKVIESEEVRLSSYIYALSSTAYEP